MNLDIFYQLYRMIDDEGLTPEYWLLNPADLGELRKYLVGTSRLIEDELLGLPIYQNESLFVGEFHLVDTRHDVTAWTCGGLFLLEKHQR